MEYQKSRATFKNGYRCLLWAVVGFCLACEGDLGEEVHSETRSIASVPIEAQSPASVPVELSLRDSLLLVFRGEIGVMEVGGDNRGERVEEYLQSCGLGAGFAWCACFVTFGFTELGVETVASAWSPDWFKETQSTASVLVYKRGIVDGHKYDWKPVDVIGIWFSNLNRIAHVGVIDSFEGEYIITIEGNTNDASSREGDAVLRKKRFKRQIYAVSRWID